MFRIVQIIQITQQPPWNDQEIAANWIYLITILKTKDMHCNFFGKQSNNNTKHTKKATTTTTTLPLTTKVIENRTQNNTKGVNWGKDNMLYYIFSLRISLIFWIGAHCVVIPRILVTETAVSSLKPYFFGRFSLVGCHN